MFAPDHSEFDMQTAAGSNNTWLNPNPNCTPTPTWPGCLSCPTLIIPVVIVLDLVPIGSPACPACCRIGNRACHAPSRPPPTPSMLQAIQMTWSLQLMMPEQQSQHGQLANPSRRH